MNTAPLSPSQEQEVFREVISNNVYYLEPFTMAMMCYLTLFSQNKNLMLIPLFVDVLSYSFKIWVFNDYFTPQFFLFFLFKQSFIIILYNYAIGFDPDVPGWACLISKMIGYVIYTSNREFHIWNHIAFGIILMISMISMYGCLGYSFSFCIHILVLTVFIKIYLKIVLNMVSHFHVKQQWVYKNLVHQIQSVLIVADKNLVITFVNKKIIGYKPEDLVGTNLKDYPFYDEQKIADLKKTQTCQKYEWNQKMTHGTDSFVTDATMQTPDDEDIALLIRDVTNEKTVELQNQRHMQSEAKLEAKNEFIASISHEIRNPLQVIYSNVDHLLSLNLEKRIMEIVQETHNSTKFLTNIIGDILDYSKIQAGMMKIIEAKYEILKVVESSVSMNSKSCLEKGLKMNLDFDYSLPKYFFGDGSRLLQIMNNFISNAIKYTQGGEVNITIRRSTSDQNVDSLYFECRDTGIGIPQENMRKLFKPFFQMNDPNASPTHYKGFGLGLRICKKLLDLMNGKYGTESEFSKGSKFWFSIPIKQIENNISIEQEFNYLSSADPLLASILHSDQAVISQINQAFRIMNFQNVELKEKDFKSNNLVFVEESLLKELPSFVKKNQIILIGKSSDIFESLKYPVLPSSIINILKKTNQQKESVEKKDEIGCLKILIVDDNLIIFKALQRLLKNLGILSVAYAKDGMEAYQMVEKNDPFDLILMDISMPVMNGVDSTKLIRNLSDDRKSKTPIFALTGNALLQPKAIQCTEWNMNGILSKPVSKNELFQVIEQLIK